MNSNLLQMGVINLTPNSFSDGGQLSSEQDVLNKCKTLLDEGINILDFGAESTAPMNKAIDASEEIKRFEALFMPILSQLDPAQFTFSIDTYRPATFSYISKEILNLYQGLGLQKNVKIIWNDVSGVVDKETMLTLRETLDLIPPSNFSYVLGHTNIQDKLDTNKHMDYIDSVDQDQFFNNLISKLTLNQNLLEEIGNLRLIIDPCFGFSKSFEQNMYLLDNLNAFFDHFKGHHFLIGLSKKSFLQKLTLEADKSQALDKSEIQHQHYFEQIRKMSKLLPLDNFIIIRTHSALAS